MFLAGLAFCDSLLLTLSQWTPGDAGYTYFPQLTCTIGFGTIVSVTSDTLGGDTPDAGQATRNTVKLQCRRCARREWRGNIGDLERATR